MNIMISLLNYVNALLPLTIGYIILWFLTPAWRYSKKTVIITSLSSLFFLILLNWLLNNHIGIDTKGRIIGLFYNVFSFFFIYLFFAKPRLSQNLFIAFLALSSTLCIAALGEIIGNDSTSLRIIIKMVFFLLLLFLIRFYFRTPFFIITSEFHGGWLPLIPIPVILSFMYVLLLSSGTLYYNQQHQAITLMLSVLTGAIFYAAYHIFSALKNQYNDQADFELLKEQMHSFQQQLQTADETAEKLNIFRHDMRHYMQILTAAIDSNNSLAATDILASMGNTLDLDEKRKLRNYTGNLMIDSVLFHYDTITQAEDICFSVNFTLCTALETNTLQLSVVLANILENAVNSCREIPVDKTREIKVTGVQRNEQYFLAIENTVIGQILFDPKTHIPISTEKGHGYGTRSIAAFAKENHALLDFYTEGNRFKVQLIF